MLPRRFGTPPGGVGNLPPLPPKGRTCSFPIQVTRPGADPAAGCNSCSPAAPGSLPFVSCKNITLRLGNERSETSHPSPALLQRMKHIQKRQTPPDKTITNKGFGITEIYCHRANGNHGATKAGREPAQG